MPLNQNLYAVRAVDKLTEALVGNIEALFARAQVEDGKGGIFSARCPEEFIACGVDEVEFRDGVRAFLLDTTRQRCAYTWWHDAFHDGLRDVWRSFSNDAPADLVGREIYRLGCAGRSSIFTLYTGMPATAWGVLDVVGVRVARAFQWPHIRSLYADPPAPVDWPAE